MSKLKRRRHLRKNPAANLTPFGRDLLIGMLIGAAEPPELDMIIGLTHLTRGALNSSTTKHADCACKGECPCHTSGAPAAGQPCPPDCKHYGDHFDGCHRCDPKCQPPEKVQ